MTYKYLQVWWNHESKQYQSPLCFSKQPKKLRSQTSDLWTHSEKRKSQRKVSRHRSKASSVHLFPCPFRDHRSGLGVLVLVFAFLFLPLLRSPSRIQWGSLSSQWHLPVEMHLLLYIRQSHRWTHTSRSWGGPVVYLCWFILSMSNVFWNIPVSNIIYYIFIVSCCFCSLVCVQRPMHSTFTNR